jgi:hypothetical protein
MRLVPGPHPLHPTGNKDRFMNEIIKREAKQVAETAVLTAAIASPVGQAAVAGATTMAVAIAPVAVLAAIGIGTFKATLFGLETAEKFFTRK